MSLCLLNWSFITLLYLIFVWKKVTFSLLFSKNIESWLNIISSLLLSRLSRLYILLILLLTSILLKDDSTQYFNLIFFWNISSSELNDWFSDRLIRPILLWLMLFYISLCELLLFLQSLSSFLIIFFCELYLHSSSSSSLSHLIF